MHMHRESAGRSAGRERRVFNRDSSEFHNRRWPRESSQTETFFTFRAVVKKQKKREKEKEKEKSYSCVGLARDISVYRLSPGALVSTSARYLRRPATAAFFAHGGEMIHLRPMCNPMVQSHETRRIAIKGRRPLEPRALSRFVRGKERRLKFFSSTFASSFALNY